MGRKRKGVPKEQASKGSIKQIEPLIVGFLSQHPTRGYQIKQIIKGLGVRDVKSKAIVTDVIFRLEDTGRIKKLRNGSYTVEASLETYTGVVV